MNVAKLSMKARHIAYGVGGLLLGGLVVGVAVKLLSSPTKTALPAGAVGSAPCPACGQPSAELATCQQHLRDANALLTASSGFIGRAVGAPAGLGERIGNYLSTVNEVVG